jgi:hypothetical protein
LSDECKNYDRSLAHTVFFVLQSIGIRSARVIITIEKDLNLDVRKSLILPFTKV